MPVPGAMCGESLCLSAFILRTERNWIISKQADQALFQAIFRGFNVCLLEVPGAVDRDCGENSQPGKEQCAVSDGKQELLQMEYSLSKAGESLKPLIKIMQQWGDEHLLRTNAPVRSRAKASA
jgi:hypothetical protein